MLIIYSSQSKKKLPNTLAVMPHPKKYLVMHTGALRLAELIKLYA